MKILTIVGARPQFIKASPVSLALREEGHKEVLLHTGQHYDHGMSQVFFDELGIAKPDINLGIGSGSHGQQTAGMLVGIEAAIKDHKPDWVLIYGDTNSTLAGAIAAAKLHLPVAHIEAGLRSFNRRMPEEINRILADSISDLLFVPTSEAVNNLRREGVPLENVHLVGDVMYDAVLMHGEQAEQRSRILENLGLEPKKYIMATVHRAENTDDPARSQAIFEGLAKAASHLPVVIPLHPRTRAALDRIGVLNSVEMTLRVIEPVGYLDMIRLEKGAAVITTDSGGVQKEAFFHRVPCVTLRDETEWVELVKMGWNRLSPPFSGDRVAEAVISALGSEGQGGQPYGKGDAAKQIARILKDRAEMSSQSK